MTNIIIIQIKVFNFLSRETIITSWMFFVLTFTLTISFVKTILRNCVVFLKYQLELNLYESLAIHQVDGNKINDMFQKLFRSYKKTLEMFRA